MESFLFKKVLNTGKRLIYGAFVCIYQKSEETSVGFIASRKVGNAVVRNKCKRRLKALVRGSDLKDVNCVFIARRTLFNTSFKKIEKQFKSCIYNVCS